MAMHAAAITEKDTPTQSVQDALNALQGIVDSMRALAYGSVPHDIVDMFMAHRLDYLVGNAEFLASGFGDPTREITRDDVDMVWFGLQSTLDQLDAMYHDDSTVPGTIEAFRALRDDYAGAFDAFGLVLLGDPGTGEPPPNSGDDLVEGLPGDDSLDAGAGDDTIVGGSGDDTLDGGTGFDAAVYGGNIADYVLHRAAGSFVVHDTATADGTDLVSSVEQLRFADMTVNLLVQAKAAAAPRPEVDRLIELYVAFFNRTPDADGLSYWIDQKTAGLTINQIAESFYDAGVQYSSLTGFSASMTNADFVDVVYRNVLGRQDGADAGGLAYWTAELAAGRESRGSLVSTILDSAHTFKGNPYGDGPGQFGQVPDLLDNKIAVSRTFAIDWGLNYNTPEDSIAQGMAIAAAITPTDIGAAMALVGIDPAKLDLVA